MRLVEELSLELGLSHSDLQRIISSAPKRYKVYLIPKRRGGYRTIAQPSRELKALQRFIIEKKLSVFPVHRCAYGYVKRRNIRHNAEAHKQKRVLLKLDFEVFFPSIKPRDFTNVVRGSGESVIEPDDYQLYLKILFWGNGSSQPRELSIGAPSSPMLSNIIMYEIDSRIFAELTRMDVLYTRYADDITFSGNSYEELLEAEKVARKIVSSTKSPRLKFNDEKRGVYARGQRRMVTGLIITPEAAVSIGRARKRLISSMIHKVVLGNREPDHIAYLKGMLGFCIANEPSFVARMRSKYGDDVVEFVLRSDIPRRSEMR